MPRIFKIFFFLSLCCYLSIALAGPAEDLESAIFDNNTSRIRRLVRQIGVANLSSERSPLYSAVFFGHLAAIRTLLDEGVPVDMTDRDGRTPLFSAVDQFSPKIAVVRLLVERGANVNAINAYGEDLLTRAARHASLPVMSYLQQHGAIIRPVSCSGSNPILEAASTGNLRYLRAVVDDVRRHISSAGRDQQTAIMLAVKQGHLQTYQWLLQQGADINLSDEQGNTLLMLAIQGGNMRIIQDLLNKGLNPNTSNNLGHSPLGEACFRNNPALIRLLIQKGGNPNSMELINRSMSTFSKAAFTELCKHWSQQTLWAAFDVLQTSVWRGDKLFFTQLSKHMDLNATNGGRVLAYAGEYNDLTLIKHLQKMGVDLDSSDGRSNETALMKAVKKGNNTVVDYLLKKGASFSARNTEGDNALHIASESGNRTALARLVRAGMDIEIHDQHGNTPLILAAARGDSATVAAIIRLGGQGSTRGSSGMTALMHAASQGSGATVRALVRHSNLNEFDTRGHSALYQAIAYHQVDAVRELLAACASITSIDDRNTDPVTLAESGYSGRAETAQIVSLIQAQRAHSRCQ